MANWDYQPKCLNEMAQHTKGQIILPTGAGKSRIEFDHAKNLMVRDDGIHQIVIVVAPKIILCQQLLTNFYEFLFNKYNTKPDINKIKPSVVVNAVKEPFTFVSCGSVPNVSIKIKDKIDKKKYKYVKVYSNKVGQSRLDTKDIAFDIWLAEAEGVDNVIFTTYKSFNVCMAGVIRGINGCESPTEVHLIADEAHYFVRHKEDEATMWSFKALRDNLDLFKTRFFFTATPKVSDAPIETGTKMNNKEVYGPVLFNMKPSELIKRGVICEPRLHKINMPLNINEDNFDKYAGDVLFRAFKVHEAVVNKENKDPNVKRIGGKVIVAVDGSKQLYSLIKNGFVQKARNRGVNVAWTMSHDDVGTWFNENEYKIEDFLVKLRSICFTADGQVKNSTRLIVLHYDRLTEGIDIPSMTGLMVLRGMNKVKKVQNIGRVLRTHPADHVKEYMSGNWVKPYSYIMVPNFEGTSDFEELIVQLRNEYDANYQIETNDDAVGLDNDEQMELQNIEYSVSPFKYVSGKVQHKVEIIDAYKKRMWEEYEQGREIDPLCF